ncbi:MAG: hypothetical protein A3K19_14940 [Lentisphaerae bacterium RIFOXYB12_FULL_65_16]|nr:MAG: hypothetical protein A3K18_27500 [Lentisphaerae bacterium RIFOXYA12_64_32]OGV85920.1 MAG: hypothetical protein A3K19_14940 [Lentisphaerae bacterium RIFOXYB12_FULL_65_16]
MTSTSGKPVQVAEIRLGKKAVQVSETETDGGGQFSYVDRNGRVLMTIGKPWGGAWAPPPVNPPSYPADYYDRLLKSGPDVLGRKALSGGGDPSYEGIVDLLPPLRFPYTFLGGKEHGDRPLPRIDWDGSIRGCLGFGLNGRPIGSGERPKFRHGLLDGYLPAIQIVYHNEEVGIGWEETATARAWPSCDHRLLVFIRLRVRNLTEQPRTDTLSVFFSHFSQTAEPEWGRDVRAPQLYPTCTGVDDELAPEWLWVSDGDDYRTGRVHPFCFLDRPCALGPKGEQTIYLVLAYPHYLRHGTFARIVPDLNFYSAIYAVKRDWDRLLGRGMTVETPEPRVNHACKATLIQSFMTVVGADVKYASAGTYAWVPYPGDTYLDGLPIAIINGAEGFGEWGHLAETKRYLSYYLRKYVRADGSCSYRQGVGAYDYGLMLHTIARSYFLGGRDTRWVQRHLAPIMAICRFITEKRKTSLAVNRPNSVRYGLVSTTLCDDLDNLGNDAYNYANDACCWLGLAAVGQMLVDVGRRNAVRASLADGKALIKYAEEYRKDICRSIERAVRKVGCSGFVPVYPDCSKPYASMTGETLASYSNYLFYPALLYTNLLDERFRDAAIAFKERRGGEVLGTSRFMDRMDDWPIALQGWAMINADRIEKFLLLYYGDLAHHRMRDVFTGYEQVGIRDEGNGRKIVAGHNICSTLATARMTKYMLVFEERDADIVWLNRAAPRRWLEDGRTTVVRNAPTRWGKVGYSIVSHVDKGCILADISIGDVATRALAVKLRLRHPRGTPIRRVEIDGKEWRCADVDNETITIKQVKRGRTRVAVYY